MKQDKILMTGLLITAVLIIGPVQNAFNRSNSGKNWVGPVPGIMSSGQGLNDIVEWCREMKQRWLQQYVRATAMDRVSGEGVGGGGSGHIDRRAIVAIA